MNRSGENKTMLDKNYQRRPSSSDSNTIAEFPKHGSVLTACIYRYYAQQKAIDTASTAAAKIEGRSRQREAQERQAEAALLQSRQQVKHLLSASLCVHMHGPSLQTATVLVTAGKNGLHISIHADCEIGSMCMGSTTLPA